MMPRVLDKTLWPCQVDTEFVSVDDSFKKQHWLKDNVGAQHTDWHLISPLVGVQRWHFAREQDAVLFQLRWA